MIHWIAADSMARFPTMAPTSPSYPVTTRLHFGYRKAPVSWHYGEILEADINRDTLWPMLAEHGGMRPIGQGGGG
jgi:hypothetical protein